MTLLEGGCENPVAMGTMSSGRFDSCTIELTGHSLTPNRFGTFVKMLHLQIGD